MDNKSEVIKGLKACNEFNCNECPYKKFDNKQYVARCMHRLIVDACQIFGGEKNGRKSDN